MSKVRIEEQGVSKRLHRISILKEKRDFVKQVENLKNASEYSALRKILTTVIENQAKLKDSHLESQWCDEANVEARKALAVEQQFRALVKLIDEPGGHIKEIDDNILRLEDEIKLAEQGEIL